MARHGGAKLGTRLAHVISKTIVSTNHKLVGVKHKLAMAVFHSISDMISAEVHRTVGTTLRTIHDGLPEDSPAKPLLKFMTTEHGQLQAMVGTAASVGGLFSSVSTIMNNELAPVVLNAVASNPHLIPDPGTLANLAAKQVISDGQAIGAIGQNGINDGWASALIEGAKMWPAMSDALDLIRRGHIGTDVAIQWAIRSGMEANAAAELVNLLGTPLSPADAALAVLRGNISQGDGEAYALQWGVNEVDFNLLIQNTGEPLGLMQLLEAYRRGFIDEGTLEKGILESRIRDEWIPTAKSLAYTPMTVSDAVNAVVQDQLDQATAEGYANENGLMPGQFQVLLNTAGEPLSRTEMEQLYNRGVVTEDQVLQALRESRLKNKYGDLAFQLHVRLPDPSVLSDAIIYGAIDQNTAVAKAMELGYSEADATTVVLSASHAKMLSYRTKIVESVVAMYEVNAMDVTTATKYITELGWSAEETAVILQSAEFNREKRIQGAAINVTRNKYVTHHITADMAQQNLAEIGVSAGEISYLMNVWGIELQSDVRQMSPTYVAKAVAASLMTQDEGIQYLVNMGYSPGDAAILVQVA